MAVRDLLERVAIDRLADKRASRLRALLAALVVGVAAAALTYKLLRR